VRPAGTTHRSKLYLDADRAGDFVSFKASQFPSSCGTSVTYSAWVNIDTKKTGFQFLLSKNVNVQDADGKPVPWGGVPATAGLSNHRINKLSFSLGTNNMCWNYRDFAHDPAIPQWGVCASFPGASNIASGSWRHVAWVFNVELNTVDFYLDGVKSNRVFSGTCLDKDCPDDSLTDNPAAHPYLKYPDTVALSGCEMNTANSYVALGHRVPGMFNFVGGIQDFRMYIGSALTETEIASLAADPEIVECHTSERGGDSAEDDTMGNSCAWYQSVKATHPQICRSEFAQTQCTYTCSSVPQCFEKPMPSIVNIIFDRVMLMESTSLDNAVLCTRRGLDVVAECKAMVVAGTWTFDTLKDAYSRGSWPVYTEVRNPSDRKYIDMFDCDKVAAALNPHCPFSVPELAVPGGVPTTWTKKMQNEVTSNGGQYSQIFWIKPTDKFLAVELAGKNHPDILFFQSISPTVLLNTLRLYVQNDVLWIQIYMFFYIILWIQIYMFSGMCEGRSIDSESVEIAVGADWRGRWLQIAMVFGAATSTGKGMRIMVDSVNDDNSADWTWCPPKGIIDPEMIQGIQFPGDLFVSPIQVLSTAITRKAVQSSFYSQRSKFAAREGPLISDDQRMTDSIAYDRRTFSYPMMLVSPPIVLQTRVKKTKECSRSKLGSDFQNYLWNSTVQGVVCAPPYECDEALINASTSLLACLDAETSNSFFGRAPQMLRGTLQFAEFLQSVTEAPLLVREGTVCPTSSKLDAQTRQVVVQMVVFAPDHGVASTIKITGDLSTQIQVSFVIEHFQALEGLLLTQYTWVAVMGMILAVLILIDKLVTVYYMVWMEERTMFFIDMVIQVVLPIVYFSIRYSQITSSGKEISKIIGIQIDGLSGVPWADTSVELNSKMMRFFEGLDMFEKKIATEKFMSYIYFLHATCALMRLIFQTSAHPRTAILVRTLQTGVDD